MTTDPAQLEAPEPTRTVSWRAAEGRDAEFQRLLMLLFGPRAPKRAEPGNG